MTKEHKEVKNLRDYFAGKALEGTLSDEHEIRNRTDLANWCYKMADAMIVARKEQTNKEHHLYINVDAGVVDTVYGDAVPDNVKLVFHVRDRVDIKAGEQIDPLPFDYQPSKLYYG